MSLVTAATISAVRPLATRAMAAPSLRSSSSHSRRSLTVQLRISWYTVSLTASWMTRVTSSSS